MKTDRNAKTTDTQISTSPSVRISVQDFGPIANGTINLRPMTVFVGPSNTGKTYFATLIYALQKILHDFSLTQVMYRHHYRMTRKLEDVATTVAEIERWEATLLDIVDIMDYSDRRFMFRDLPRIVRDRWQVALTDHHLLGNSLADELCRCFGLRSVSQLIRMASASDSAAISLDVGEGDCSFWDFKMNISDSGLSVEGEIRDMTLFRDSDEPFYDARHRGIDELRNLIDEAVDQFFDKLLLNAYIYHEKISPHYLPAARVGIIQSHRVLSGLYAEHAVRAGLGPLPVVPTFPGVLADFIEDFFAVEFHDADDDQIARIADRFESEMLDGHLLVAPIGGDGGRVWHYRPRETDKEIPLDYASSMVSELAALALFLRRTVRSGDTIIIEEPEAHLHPAAQTEMAKTLGRLVRAGVRVVVTTHSDWLLKEIGNLVREGELKEKTGEPDSDELLPSSLLPSDVGVWQFRKDGTSNGATVQEIPYDRIEGVEPEEYEYVSEELYNRSADLQNQLAETADGTKYEHE
ncbi:MAG: AAA family ATPase [Candidatus Poribacteria bacterium]|nr:AAA family ATPase [Candidatus Poribacteria bacterium]